MGIEVSPEKAVSLNDEHEKGVDTSVEGNSTRQKLKAIQVLNVFSRNRKGDRRGDGNPLIHPLKGRRGFTITLFWKNQLGGYLAALRALELALVSKRCTTDSGT
jgi:hypothetical protein